MTTLLRPGSPREVGMLPERIARARDLCAGWVKSGHTPTLCVCVARRGVIVLHEAFGIARPGPDSAPLAPNALWPVASVTKAVTATLAMQLVEDGLLGLNRPAKNYLPEISGVGADEILVHNLLTHTSGYPGDYDPRFAEHPIKKLEAGFEATLCPGGMHPLVHQGLSLYWDLPLATKVGEVMVYANHNYELLGEIVRRISGQSLERRGRERLFGPLGMHDSYYEVPESEAHRVVQRASGLPLADPVSPFMMGIGSRQLQETPWAGAGLFTTPLDLTIFGQAFLNGGRYGGARILSPASVASMTRDQIPGVPALFAVMRIAQASWGYGFAVTSPSKWRYFEGSLHSLGSFGHSGAGTSTLWVDPPRELVGTYFEVTTRVTEGEEYLWNFDLFQNAISAAVDDA